MQAFRRASHANIATIATRMPDNGRVLIVTGASSGIGAALARTAADAGYRVAIVARRVERLEKVARAIHDAGGTVVSVAGDVTAGDMPERIVATAMTLLGESTPSSTTQAAVLLAHCSIKPMPKSRRSGGSTLSLR